MAANDPLWRRPRHYMDADDALVFEVADDQVEDLVKEVKVRMESAAELKVPLIVDAGIGENWDEAH